MCTSNSNEAETPIGTKSCWLAVLRFIILNLFITVHQVVDAIIDKLFSIYYKGCKKQVPPVKSKLLLYSALDLAKEIKNKSVKSEEVVQAYIDRIVEINPILNSVVDSRFDAALEEARKVDEALRNGSYTAEQLENMPFLGVPFSTKVSTCVKGLRHTIGLVSRRNTVAKEDADVVKVMRGAGGIPLAVTNVPELGMWYETWCTVHGQTFNPYDTTRTTGGSSGGEAALVSACGSPIGIGTDIGGSLRMPAFFCGIFAHKPTTGLTPLKGLNRRTGQETRTMVAAGPMCRHSKDLLPSLRVLVGLNQNLLKLGSEVNPKRLKYYFMMDDSSSDDGLGGDLRLSSVDDSLRICMLRVVSHLKEENAFVKQVSKESFHIVNWVSSLELANELTQLTTLEDFLGTIRQENAKSFFLLVRLTGMRYGFPLWRYWMTQEPEKFSRELANGEGEICLWTELPKKLLNMSDFSLPAIMRLTDEKLPPINEKWARETTIKLQNDISKLLGDDGILLYPSHPFPAFYRNSSLLRPYNFAYTAVLNVLNLPVTQVPMGLNKDGVPLGLQVVATSLNDHLTIGVARYLEEVFGGWVPPTQRS